MKKLMFGLFAVAFAASLQAANFRWYNSAAIAAAGDSNTDVTSGTVYLFAGSNQSDIFAAIVGGSDWTSGAVGSAVINGETSFGSTTVASASITSGRAVWTETTTDASRQYFQVLVDGDNFYIADTISVTVKGTGNSNIAFGNNESLAAIRDSAAGYQGGGWYAVYAVPEPTSGLLMLLGMAGLALKRKRA
mgnify:CR=1 FL=1